MTNKLEVIGGITAILGFVLSMNSIENIFRTTGNVIAERVYSSIGSFFGIFFLVLGFLLVAYGSRYEDKKQISHGLK